MSGKSIFIQAIGLFGTVLFFLSYECKNNRPLFRVQFVSYLCYTTHLLMLGAMTELYGRISVEDAVVVFSAFVLSRAAVAAAIMMIAPSKKSGLLYTFSSGSSRHVVCISSAAVLAACFLFIFLKWKIRVLFPLAGILILGGYFVRMVRRHFGGLSGDLCGWFIHMQELALMLSFVLALAV